MDTLAFGYILPTTGRIPDLHRLETCAAGRTKKRGFASYSKLEKKQTLFVYDVVQMISRMV